jgi:CBS domain-containing protein
MTARVVAVKKDAYFKDMAALMWECRVSAFPVVDEDGMVIGVVSEGDLLAKEALVAGGLAGELGARSRPGLTVRPGPARHGDLAKAGGVTAADVMSLPPVVVTADEPVTSAARLMYSARVKSLPVVTEDGYLTGIISRADVLSVYRRPDGAIASDIIDNVLARQFGVGRQTVTVSVSKGVVTLEGRLEIGPGPDLAAAIWQVEGVVAVRDRLVFSDERSAHVLSRNCFGLSEYRPERLAAGRDSRGHDGGPGRVDRLGLPGRPAVPAGPRGGRRHGCKPRDGPHRAGRAVRPARGHARARADAAGGRLNRAGLSRPGG